MKHRWIFRLIFLTLFAWLAWKAWTLAGDDPILLLIFFIFAGAIGGLFAVKVVLPYIAEAIGTSIYLSGEKLPTKTEDEETEEETVQEDSKKEG
jgi:hypothetical protein